MHFFTLTTNHAYVNAHLTTTAIRSGFELHECLLVYNGFASIGRADDDRRACSLQAWLA